MRFGWTRTRDLVRGQAGLDDPWARRSRRQLQKPPTPRNTFLRSFHSNVDKGTHHEVLLYDDAPLAQARTCSGDPSTPLFYPYLTNGLKGAADLGTTSGKNLVQLATGVGPYDYVLPTTYGIFLDATGDGQWVSNHHYLNVSPRDLTVGASFEMHVTDYVADPLGRMFAGAGQNAISVPVHTMGTNTGTLVVPFDVELVLVASHMPAGLEGSKGYEMCSVWSYYSYPRGHGYTGRVPPLLGGDVASDKGSVEMTYDQATQTANLSAASSACPSGG